MNSHYLLAKIAASVCQLCNRTADFNLHVLVWVKTTTADLLISQLVIDYYFSILGLYASKICLL